MPLYSFFCHTCENKFEQRMTFSQFESKDYVCPKCDSENITQTFGELNIIKNKTEKQEKKVGDVVKETIEENREILKEMKREFSEQRKEWV